MTFVNTLDPEHALDIESGCRYCGGRIIFSPIATEWWHYSTGRRACPYRQSEERLLQCPAAPPMGTPGQRLAEQFGLDYHEHVLCAHLSERGLRNVFLGSHP